MLVIFCPNIREGVGLARRRGVIHPTPPFGNATPCIFTEWTNADWRNPVEQQGEFVIDQELKRIIASWCRESAEECGIWGLGIGVNKGRMRKTIGEGIEERTASAPLSVV
jgi:hypothetical protein